MPIKGKKLLLDQIKRKAKEKKDKELKNRGAKVKTKT